MSSKTGILLVNLGTPRSPSVRDVYRYLTEFLTDKRVVDFPWLKRQLLVRGIIIPARIRQSAKSYQAIWTREGSPLMVYGRKVKQALQKAMGNSFAVELAMRYQQPTIGKGLENLLKEGVDHLIILPLFPQYASATTGSVHEKAMGYLSKLELMPKITFIDHFCDHPAFIEAFTKISIPRPLSTYDHILFSFHGLPQRQLINADLHERCFKKQKCCETSCYENQQCYSAQCFRTADKLIQALDVPKSKTTICFQSRLGKEPWLEPYTSGVITDLAKKGKRHVLVFCPSFVCDCLETTYEIGQEYHAEFKHAGGQSLDLASGLNDHPQWISALKTIILDHKAAT